MVIDLGVGQVTLFLAAGNQELQLRLAVFGHHCDTALYAKRGFTRPFVGLASARAGADTRLARIVLNRSRRFILLSSINWTFVALTPASAGTDTRFTRI